jgi:hypothetical protein
METTPFCRFDATEKLSPPVVEEPHVTTDRLLLIAA